MARGAAAVRCWRRQDAAESRRSRGQTWSSDRDVAHLALAAAPALPRSIEEGSGQHRLRSGRCRSRTSLSPPDSNNMSAGPEIVERQPAVVGTSNGNGSTRGDGAGVIKRGIDLLHGPELNK